MPARKLFPRLRLDWPLLGKELLEQAARKQMYIIRVVYALVLFGAFSVYYGRHLAEGPVLALGRGLGPFNFLVAAQLAAIFLFLPPLMAGALAQEKERETLGLLFLTDLTPWELILQKYVGRLIPMLTLLFLSLPLLAVAYSLGGVSAGMLYFSAATLFLNCLWVGALALECSAHEATTFQALVRCWGICLAFATCCSMGMGPFPFFLLMSRMSYGPPSVPSAFMVPMLFPAAGYLLTTFLFLLRAQQILEARAFVQRRNPFGHQFKQLDQYWKDLRKLLRAILRKRDPQAYADAEQVVRRGLGEAWDRRAGSFRESYGDAKGRSPGLGRGGGRARRVFGVVPDVADADSPRAGVRDHFRSHRAHRLDHQRGAGPQVGRGVHRGRRRTLDFGVVDRPDPKRQRRGERADKRAA